MDLWPDWDTKQWTTLFDATTAVATAVATIVSVIVALVFRWLDKQRVDWVIFGAEAKWIDHGSWVDGPMLSAELANVGDGTALHVRAEGLGCNVELRGPLTQGTHRSWRDEYELRPAMKSGDEVHLIVNCDPKDWARAEIAITWTASPSVRRARRVWREPLRLVHAPPVCSRLGLDENGFEGEVPIPASEEPPLLDIPAPQRPTPPQWWDVPSRLRLRAQLRQARSAS